MKILHVLSQFQVTGAEVFAATLANKQVEEGHTVHLFSDTWHTLTKAVYHKQPIGIRTYKQRFSNVFAIRAFVKSNAIDVVHAHSRAASWVCNLALKGLKVPLVSHVHGRQHVHTSSKSFDIYGDRVLVVCDNLKTHLTQEIGLQAHKVHICPNGFEWRKILHITPTEVIEPYQGKTVLLAGRTTGPKGAYAAHLIATVIPAVLKLVAHNWRLVVAGGPLTDMPDKTQQVWAALQTQFKGRFIWVGFTDQLPALIKAADVVIGSGRVAIEALGMGKPVIALGEWCTHGLVTDRNIEQVVASNFGDIGARLPHPGIDWSAVQQSLIEAITGPHLILPSDNIINRLKQEYDVDLVYGRIMDHYHAARAKKLQPKQIPILMYHKVPLEPLASKHRIFVTKSVFEKHLKYLKSEGFTTITFKQYDAWKTGQLPQGWMPKKPIILTFDDAYLDNYTNAWPLLKQYGMTCVIFALGDPELDYNAWDVKLGEPKEPLMSLAQKREMALEGVEFGAHTMTHADLTKLSLKEAGWEIQESKRRLTQDLEDQVISFAYPYGRTNHDIEREVKRAGFKYAVVINERAGLHLEDNPVNIFRAYIFPEDIGGRYAKKTSWWYRRYFKWKRGQ